MERSVFFALVAFTFLFLFLYLLYLILRPFLPALGWAAVIVIATYPVFKRFIRFFGGRKTLAAAMMTVIVFLIIVIPAIFLMGALVKELTDVQELVSQWTEEGSIETWNKIVDHPWVAPILERFQGMVKRTNIDVQGAAIEAAKRVVALLFGSLGGVVKQAALLLFELVLIVISLFFLYRDGEKITKAFLLAIPISETRKGDVHETVENLVSAVVIGVLVTASIQGILAGIGYRIVGLPSSALLGTLSGICALIPVVGSGVIWIPAVVYLLLSGNWVYGLILLGWSILVVGMVDNLLRPLLISGRSGLSFTLIALGGLGGLAAFGFFGLVAGPVIIAVFMLTLEMYQSEVAPPPVESTIIDSPS